MRIDVSEIKTYRECKRKWLLSSRNGFHMTTQAPNDNLRLGTLFHEALHSAYMGGDFQKILNFLIRESLHDEMARTLSNMFTEYYKQVLIPDLQKYQILQIEHSFKIVFKELPGVEICGSVDMLALNTDDGKIYGFEHKTAKKLRPHVYNVMDEQPMLYTIALREYVAEKYPGVEFGGIYLNQVQKTIKIFTTDRFLCTYSDTALENFRQGLIATILKVQDSVLIKEDACEPGSMKCDMCWFKSICEFYGMETLESASDILQEFGEEFAVREMDHLDEKNERAIDND